MASYETRRDMIVTHAWECWTKNGLRMDDDMRAETEKTVQDAVNNTYLDGISDSDWLDATLRALGEPSEPSEDEVRALVREALAEDKREGSHFDAAGFGAFFPEDNPDAVLEAWHMYCRHVYGGESF